MDQPDPSMDIPRPPACLFNHAVCERARRGDLVAANCQMRDERHDFHQRRINPTRRNRAANRAQKAQHRNKTLRWTESNHQPVQNHDKVVRGTTCVEVERPGDSRMIERRRLAEFCHGKRHELEIVNGSGRHNSRRNYVVQCNRRAMMALQPLRAGRTGIAVRRMAAIRRFRFAAATATAMIEAHVSATRMDGCALALSRPTGHLGAAAAVTDPLEVPRAAAADQRSAV